jgi:CelD/BcsL family acetyltransferase involved in cellulose biosynthesis
LSISQLAPRLAASKSLCGDLLISSLQTTIAESAAAMDDLAPLWNRLLCRQRHTLFQRFSWNRLAAEVFSDRLTPCVVSVENDSGAAIIPAAINKSSNRIELLGETLFDYRDVLHSGGKEVLQQAWRELTAQRKALHVVAIEGEAADERWDDFPVTPFASAPGVALGSTNDNVFRLAHSRLGRQLRRLQKRGVEFRSSCGDNAELVRRIYDSKRLQAAADRQANLFLDPLRCEFVVAAAAMEADGCRVSTLERREELVAGLVAFDDGANRRFYTTYFNPAWAPYSPGQVLLYEATAQSLTEGFRCDYMTGEYPYKLRLANTSRQLLRVDLSAEQLAELATRSHPHA